MKIETYENINLSIELDPLRGLIGSIVKCTKRNGKVFSARLIAVTASGELWFENRKGEKTMDKRHVLDSISPYTPYSPEGSS